MSRAQADQWMLHCASHTPGPVLDVARELVAGAGHRIHVVTRGGEKDLLYAPGECGLEDGLHGLERGEFRSLRVDVHAGLIDWALLFAPRFAGDRDPWWSVVVQQSSGDPLRVFRVASQRPGLRFAVLTADETLDDLPAQPNGGNFPWDHPGLVLGAVFTDGGEVTARLGPYLVPPPAAPGPDGTRRA